MQWSSFFRNKFFRNEFIISVFILVVALFFFSRFLLFNENRNGVTLDDPFLHLFSAVDMTWLIFGLIYISIVLILLSLARLPKRLLFVIQCYSLLLLVRMITMFLMPLSPPQGMILLNFPK